MTLKNDIPRKCFFPLTGQSAPFPGIHVQLDDVFDLLPKKGGADPFHIRRFIGPVSPLATRSSHFIFRIN